MTALRRLSFLVTHACALGTVALAQEPLAEGAQEEKQRIGETIVTARKYEEALLDVPGSITVIDSQVLEDAGILTLQDASIFVPNLRLTEFSSRRLSFPFIRGVGSGLGDPAVITYIDGVPQFGTGGTNLPLLDVQRVEFLRGPQGALYGRNALGGLISVITELPSPTPSYGGSVTFGNFDLQRYELGASGPVGDDGAGYSAAGLYSKRDGYTKNDFTGNDVDFRDAFFGRGQLLFTPSDESIVRFTIFGEHARDGGFVLSDIQGLKARPFRIDQDFEGQAERDVVSPAIIWDVLGDEVDFESISAYQHWDILETSDFDFSAIDGVRRRTEESQGYFYQELRLGSAAGAPVHVDDGLDMTWQVGASGFYSDSDLSAANDLRPGLFPPPAVGIATSQGDFKS